MSGESLWWHNAVVYQVYLRSFADGDGDGIGDLAGLRSRLGYVAALGVDAIWINPFYPSPLADGGYDVTDHCAVDPLLGTIEEFAALIDEAHELGLHIIIDVIPNHTSDQHPWFLAALAAPAGSPERARYLFLDGDRDGPPSDWESLFGGSAWERVPDEQWYCHVFAREQPDLNWSNDEVQSRFNSILRFWADLGVDGFRVDAAHCPKGPLVPPLRSRTGVDQLLPEDGSDPVYDHDQVHDIYRGWRTVLDGYDPPRMAVAETWHPPNSRTYLYARHDELGQVFDFELLKAPWCAEQMASAITRSLAGHAAVGSQPSWVLSSHDVIRAASRYALPPGADPDQWLRSGGTDPVVDPALGLRRARSALLMMLALPGCAYLYQGEELGLFEVADLPAAALRDPVWERNGHRQKGRDGCRVPLPWARNGPSLGFGVADAWLPQPAWFADSSVEALNGEGAGVLELYRSALRLRRELTPDDMQLRWHASNRQVLHFARSNGWECIVNFSDDPVPMPQGQKMLVSELTVRSLVPPDGAAWIMARRPSDKPTPGSLS